MNKRITHYPLFSNRQYIKLNLNHINFPMHLSIQFRNTFNRLPPDPYIDDNSRNRRYGNYKVSKINDNFPDFYVKHTGKTIYKQNVNDDRNKERLFHLLENPHDIFVIEYIKYISQILNKTIPFNELNIDLHQVRQIVYPDTISHNSPEGIHKDGSDFVVPALVFNRFNIKGGISYIYDNNKNEIYNCILNKNDFTFMSDKNLYHYVSPIEYYISDGFEEYGYRDLLGLDINIIE